MSKSYTNKEGDLVKVTDKHLVISTKIKLELQKASPSRKCAWNTHKKLMEKEGFFDSDTNESYRCMIKAYQKKVGELPSVIKYADLVADGKLESIKELVGEVAYEKRENQHVLKQLNQVKRDVIDFTLIAEQVKSTFENYDWSQLKFKYEPIKKKKNKMVVCLSDLHIGALVDTEDNKFNYEVAQNRMQQYLNKVLLEIEINRVSDVHLMNLGDVIEHPYMHNLAYTSEFNFAEQITRASDLIIKFMIKLSEKVNVTVAGIAGNHDRFNENKNMSLDGDHAVKVVNIAIESFIENAKPKRIKYEQAKDYGHNIVVNGINIKFVHGDLDSLNDMNLVAKHSSIDGKDYNIVVMGHYHHHFIKEQGVEKCVVGFGTLKGSDSYGQKIRRLSSPSQGIIIVDEDGNYDIKRIKLT